MDAEELDKRVAAFRRKKDRLRKLQDEVSLEQAELIALGVDDRDDLTVVRSSTRTVADTILAVLTTSQVKAVTVRVLDQELVRHAVKRHLIDQETVDAHTVVKDRSPYIKFK